MKDIMQSNGRRNNKKPFQAMVEKDPYAIFIFRFHAQGLYEENNLEDLVIWSVASESIIHKQLKLGLTL